MAEKPDARDREWTLRQLEEVRAWRRNVESMQKGREQSVELASERQQLIELEKKLQELDRKQRSIERLERWNERLERWHSRIPEYDRSVGLSLLPIFVWVIVLELAGTRPAIGAAWGAAIVLFFVQRRFQPERGAVFWLAVFSLLIFTGASIVGIVLESDKAFLAQDPVSDFAIAVIFAISLIFRKPLLGMAIREIFPRVRRALPPENRALMWVTAAFVVENLVMGVVRVWLLDEVSPGAYPFVSRAVGTPIRLILVWWAYRIIQDEMKRRLAAGLWEDVPKPSMFPKADPPPPPQAK